MYSLFMLLSRVGLVLVAIDAVFLVGYPVWLLHGFATKTGFYAPLKMREYSGFAALVVLFVVIYIVGETIARYFKKEDKNG